MNTQNILFDLNNIKNKLVNHIDYLTAIIDGSFNEPKLEASIILDDLNQLILKIINIDNQGSSGEFYTQIFRSLDEFLEDDSENANFPCKYGISFDSLEQDLFYRLFDLQAILSAGVEIELETNNGDGTFSGMLLLTIDDMGQMLEVKSALSVLEVEIIHCEMPDTL